MKRNKKTAVALLLTNSFGMFLALATVNAPNGDIVKAISVILSMIGAFIITPIAIIKLLKK